MSFEVILPFLRPIAHLIQDPEVTEIMVNGSRRVFIERDGLLREVVGVRLDERNLRVAVKNIARALGDDVSEEHPILDARLPDGSRVAAVFPPCSVGGTTLTIRKFQTRFFTADELVRVGTMTPDVLSVLGAAIAAGANVHQWRHQHGRDDDPECADHVPPARRAHRLGRRHRGAADRARQSRAPRGQAGATAVAGKHDS